MYEEGGTFVFLGLDTKNSQSHQHSLTKKLVGYRNWRQKSCKKERNKVLGKG